MTKVPMVLRNHHRRGKSRRSRATKGSRRTNSTTDKGSGAGAHGSGNHRQIKPRGTHGRDTPNKWKIATHKNVNRTKSTHHSSGMSARRQTGHRKGHFLPHIGATNGHTAQHELIIVTGGFNTRLTRDPADPTLNRDIGPGTL